MKNNLTKISVLVIILLTSLNLRAQDDMDALLKDADAPAKKEFTTATFKGTRLINLHTVEVTGKRGLDFRISHWFGWWS
jgi:hypothetical protein